MATTDKANLDERAGLNTSLPAHRRTARASSQIPLRKEKEKMNHIPYREL